MADLTGRLLIANGNLFDPNFRKTVVLIAEHGEDGALGLILNRPSDSTVAESAPALAPLVPEGEPVFVGGPVLPGAAAILADFDRPDLADSILFGTVGVLAADPEELSQSVRRARVFAGYAGWGPGQLERELEETSWIIATASSVEVFTDHPEELWGELLRSMGGNYALMSSMPFDPSAN